MRQISNAIKKWWPLFLIFLLALVIRTWNLNQLPGTFFEDEVLSGYLGRYLWENGTDVYGNKWPFLYFNKFGDYYIILPMYLDGLSTYLFGLTWFAVRFPTALLASLSVLPLAGIAFLAFRSRKVAFLSALLFALLPWHIVLARATTESVIELFFLLSAALSLMWGWKKSKIIWVAVALLVSVFTYFIYHTSRLILPLLWMGGFVLYWHTIKSKKSVVVLSIAAVLLLVSLTLYISSTPWGKGRLVQISVFSEQSGVQGRIQEMIYNLGPNSAQLARLVHNKPLGFGRELLRQYLSYFSPVFLFTSDGWLKTRYGVPEAGPVLVLYGISLLTLFLPVKKKFGYDKQGVLFLLWILIIAVIPASFTVVESPSIRRSILLTVPLCVFAAFALYRTFYFRIWKVVVGWLLLGVLLVEWFLFALLYVKQSDRVTSVYRTDGYPQLASFLVENRDTFERIHVANKNTFPMYYLFAKQDFSPDWTKRFGFNLSIDSMDTIALTNENCPSQLVTNTSIKQYSARELFIDEKLCPKPSSLLQQVGTLEGVNPLLGFRLYMIEAAASEHQYE